MSAATDAAAIRRPRTPTDPDAGDPRLLRDPRGPVGWAPDAPAAAVRRERGVLWTQPGPVTARDVDRRLAALGWAHALHDLLCPAMSPATSADPDNWRDDRPAWGHCAIVSVIAFDLLGGAATPDLQIVRSDARLPDGRTIGHYWVTWNGAVIDPTRLQFPAGTVIDEAGAGPRRRGHASTRSYILSHGATAARHARLLTAAPGDLGARLAFRF
jgi:hypothetical protein